MPKMRYDEFVFGDVLGEGSYGEVVKAEMKESAREQYPRFDTYVFAVKRVLISFVNKEQAIKERTGRDVVKQVMLERQLLTRLNSPHIVTLFGSFKTTDELFYVLTYQDGGDLRQLLNDKAALTSGTVAFYSAEIFAALFYLSEQNVIHRDVKPENILLHQYANGVHLKLCDFATACDLTQHDEGHKPRTFVGSAEYVSPELLGSNKYTCFESDLWAAACIVYFMLSGLPPFRGHEYAIFKKIEQLDFDFPDTFHDRGRLLIEALLKLDPNERLGSGRRHEQIKNHCFFEHIKWDDLHRQNPPKIDQYLAPATDETPPLDTVPQEESTEKNSLADDSSGQGIPFVLAKEQYDQAIKDQRVNKNNVAHKWRDFVDDELIIKMGYMEKKRGLFPRRRMFLLTGGTRDTIPRMVYVDANEWIKKGEIVFHEHVTFEQKTFSRFYIIDPHKGRSGRVYDLTDKNSYNDINAGAVQWLRKLKTLKESYFSSSS